MALRELRRSQNGEAGIPPDNVRTCLPYDVRTKVLEVQMAITASKLRANVYRLLDEVIDTGQPLEIERKGKTLIIAPKEQESIWDRLPRREGFIVGDPDELVHIDWSSEWNPDPN
jgi:hypothetical protein